MWALSNVYRVGGAPEAAAVLPLLGGLLFSTGAHSKYATVGIAIVGIASKSSRYSEGCSSRQVRIVSIAIVSIAIVSIAVTGGLIF